MAPARAGRISAFALDGTNLPQNTFGPTSNPFSISPYNLDGIAASVKPAPLPAAPTTLTTTATSVKAPAASAAVKAAAAQKRKKKKAAPKRRTPVVYYM